MQRHWALPSALSATGVWWLTLGVVVGNVLLFLHWYWMWRRLIAMECLLLVYSFCGFGGSKKQQKSKGYGPPDPPLDVFTVMQQPTLIPGIEWGESEPLRHHPSLESSWCIIPHPTKVDKGGEDALFLTPLSAGCADGVGGWAARGIDAGLYSGTLMRGAEHVALRCCAALQGDSDTGLMALYQALAADSSGGAQDRSDKQNKLLAEAQEKLAQLHPLSLMQCGYEACSKQHIVGSSTACIVALMPRITGMLSPKGDGAGADAGEPGALCMCVGNLGDSGLMMIRDGEIIFRTIEQTHAFNFPRQLGTGSQDTPKDADVTTIDAQEGDIVIIASDGVWDNVFDEDLRSFLAQRQAISSPTLARDLALHAYCRARDRNRISPFVRRGVEAGCLDKKKVESGQHSGGKVDDISIIVSTLRIPQSS